MRYLLSLFMLALVFTIGCGPEPVNPCESHSCGSNGSCVVQNDQATCKCKDGWHGSECNSSLKEDFTLGYKTICQDGGSLTLTGLTGEDAKREGYTFTVAKGALDRCVIMAIAYAGAPTTPYTKGQLQAHEGFRVVIIDPDEPYKGILPNRIDDKIFPAVKVLLPGKRATVLTYADLRFHELKVEFTAEGTIFTMVKSQFIHTSNSKPTPKVQVSPVPGKPGTFQASFVGTTDEGSTNLALLTFKGLAGGTPLDWKKVSEGVYEFSLPEGSHKLDFQVSDTYQATADVPAEVTVQPTDLCKDVTCTNSWEQCNAATGKCEGQHPCHSHSCEGGKECKLDSADQPTCECPAGQGWNGTACEEIKKPEISNLRLDCSRHRGYCTSEQTYDLLFDFKHVTRFDAKVESVNLCDKNAGSFSLSEGDLIGQTHTLQFTMPFGCRSGEIKIIVTVYGLGGETSASINVKVW